MWMNRAPSEIFGRLPPICIALALTAAAVAAQTSSTSGEFWPEIDVRAQIRSNVRLSAFGGLKEGEEFPFQQWNAGAGLGYQWNRISGPHRLNLDRDKEHHLVVAAGYESLRTIQSGKDSEEHRVGVEATPRHRPFAWLLLEDRNRFEFRWVNGEYSTRYRNRVTAEHDLCVNGLRFTPFVSAEFFYGVQKSAWQKQQYAGGFRVPYDRFLAVELYYLRQDCPTCGPAHLNVAGLKVNLYFDTAR
jgi:hypothetical protein